MHPRFSLPALLALPLFAGLLPAKSSAQTLNDGYFSPPMAHQRVLAGSFGELRDGHFHGGIDLKTQFVIGKEILAPASGYVSRASISWGGYGLALYICHPNGYTTVYGHLSGFAPKIDSLVRKRQYEQQSYAVDLSFDEGEIPVHAGERVAWSGNTGGSMGPHLHFEIRFLGMDLNPNEIVDFDANKVHNDIFMFRSAPYKAGTDTYYANGSSYSIYRVRSGDTLSGIAKKYRTSVNMLCRLNKISPKQTLKVGQRLRVN